MTTHGGLGVSALAEEDTPRKSTSTITIVDIEARSITKQPSIWCRMNRNWVWEILSCIGAVAALFSGVGVLYRYDNHALPNLPYGMTINAVLSWIIQLFNALILGVVASCLSQSVWIHFSATRRPLSDITAYDWASRGFTGCVAFAWRSRMAHLASLGAIITIFAIGVGPFVQQMTSVHNNLIADTVPASLGRGQVYTETLIDGGRLPTRGMMSSIYSSIFSCTNEASQSQPDNAGSLLPTIPRDCPTGECHFPPFRTLAVCSSCTDLSSMVSTLTEQVCRPGLIRYEHSLPNGLWFNVSNGIPAPDQLFKTSTLPLTDDMRTKAGVPWFGDSEIMNLTEIRMPSPSNLSHATATHCSLYWCVNTYSAIIQNGQADETLLSTWNNPGARYTDPSTGRLDLHPPPVDNLTSSSNFTVSAAASSPITSWLQYKMQMSNYDTYECVEDVGLTILQHEGTEFDPPITTSSLQGVFSRVATGMTIRVRQLDWKSPQGGASIGPLDNAGPAKGTSWRFEMQIHVRWGWITLPVLLAILTVVFLAMTMVRTRGHGLEVWKSSPTPMFCSGLEDEVQREIRAAGDPILMEEVTRGVQVNFQRCESYWRLKAT